MLSKDRLAPLRRFKYGNKTRLGKNNDGGYVIAPDLSYDLFLSAGISDDISFEDDFLSANPNIHGFAFDGTITQVPQYESKSLQVIKKNISTTSSAQTTNLLEFVQDSWDIFLKMDIEGAEWKFFEFLQTEDITRFKQMCIEFHGLPRAPIEILKKINKTHKIIHLHPNNHSGLWVKDLEGETWTLNYRGAREAKLMCATAIELTFLRNSEFDNEPEFDLSPIPSKLDMPNVFKRTWPIDSASIIDLDEISLHGFPYTEV